MSRDTRLPLIVIAGFLGSGKTSCLQHLASDGGRGKWAWIVNDFADYDVDGRRLADAGLEVTAVAGGSVFCTCLGARFGQVMGQMAARHEKGEIDTVVIEASGIARPSGVIRMLREHGLEEKIGLAAVVTLVDPTTVLALSRSLGAVADQIECATHLVVNKTDLSTAGDASLVVGELSSQNPDAQIIMTTYGRIDLSVPETFCSRLLKGAPLSVPDQDFPRFSISHDAPLDLGVLSGELLGIGRFMHRAKGILKGRDGFWSSVDYAPSGGVAIKRLVGGTQEGGGFVAIAVRGAEGPVQNLMRGIVEGRFA